mmetsp:Transcript_11088/g.37766  ORF Transcript_11088/g.37766 Transcript_11088/m.37766 type:complete len:299 (+) Transcript_11088:36-932(+)
MHPALLVLSASLLPATAAYIPPADRHHHIPRSAFRSAIRAPLASSVAPNPVDELIKQMRTTSTQQLPKLVVDNIQMINATFFLRLAELSDATEDRLEKARLSELADIVARTLQSAVEKTDEIAESKSQQAQELLAILAEENGEFVTPVPVEKVDKLRQAMRARLGQLDETFVATLRSFLNKCRDDEMSGMVLILQRVLQVFASEVLIAMTSGVREELREPAHAFLLAEPQDWERLVRKQVADGDISADQLSQLLKEEVAQAVLELPSGSLTQSVVAEFLGEAIKLVDRVGEVSYPGSE